MSPRFLTAVEFVLQHETVYARGRKGYDYAIAEHDPDDPGGTTKFGIDQRNHPEIDIERLTVDRARQIYETSYWGPSHAAELPLGVGEICFDTAVNCGLGKAATWLQETLAQIGLYHGGIDARIGLKTLFAATHANPEQLCAQLIDRRRHFYERLAASPRFKKFLKGWLNRCDDLAEFVKTLEAYDLRRYVAPLHS